MMDPDDEIARRRFAVGLSHYGKGDYVAALAEFEAARRAMPLPALQYNIARCLDRLERTEEAIVAYKVYVSEAPKAKNIEDVLLRMSMLQVRRQDARSVKTLPPEPLPPPAGATPTAR